jgi:hypothetical protein
VTPAERERIREAARAVAAEAPPLTEEQKQRLRLILGPHPTISAGPGVAPHPGPAEHNPAANPAA